VRKNKWRGGGGEVGGERATVGMQRAGKDLFRSFP
jgi:hypothetical protein